MPDAAMLMMAMTDITSHSPPTCMLPLKLENHTVVRCFHFDTDLRERWWGEALKWACAAHSRHLASRSHQV